MPGERPGTVHVPPEQLARGAALPKVNFRTYGYMRGENRVFMYDPPMPEIRVYEGSKKAGDAIKAFDVRAVGLLFPESYRGGDSLEEAFRPFMRRPPTEVVQDGDSLFRVRWVLNDGNNRRTLWIDTSKGFSPVRFEVQDRNTEKPRDDGTWPEPYLVNTAQWQQIGKVWVPVRFSIEQRLPAALNKPDGGPSVWRYDHEFTWELVNQQVPRDLFDITKLGFPKGTQVTNYSSDQPVIERILGFGEQESKRQIAIVTGGVPAPLPTPISRWRIFFIVANLILALVLGAVWMRRVLRRTTQRGR